MILEPVHEHDIFTNVKSYAKIYPRMTKLYEFNHVSKVRMRGFEPRLGTKKMHSINQFTDPVSAIDSLRRTKTRLRDIVICNEFDLFCTFTFAKDRDNIDLIKKRMSTWLNNQQFRTGHFDYLIVPEFHKDGKAIHFHALFKGYKGNLKFSGHRFKSGRKKYEFPAYTLGINSAAKIESDPESYQKVGNYIGKYITKDMPQFKGKKRYWCSHALIRPEKVQNPVMFPDLYKQFTENYRTTTSQVFVAHKKLNLIPEQRGKPTEWGRVLALKGPLLD